MSAARTKASRAPKLTFHEGEDYACLMLPHQTTDAPLAMIYGDDKTARAYGKLFAAAQTMKSALGEIATSLREIQSSVAFAALPAVTRALIEKQAMKADEAIAEAEGR